jgi:enterochelin esterase-like enzyme
LVTRSNELNTNPDFAFFVGEELFPYIKEKYNISSDSRETVVGGASLGGLSASYMGLKYPDKFGKILSQSGSYWAPKKLIEDIDHHFRKWQYLIGEYMKKDKLPLEFYIEIGVYEGTEALHGAPSHFFSNRYFQDVILSKGYPVKYVEYIGGHDFICWRGSLANGLIYLIGK